MTYNLVTVSGQANSSSFADVHRALRQLLDAEVADIKRTRSQGLLAVEALSHTIAQGADGYWYGSIIASLRMG